MHLPSSFAIRPAGDVFSVTPFPICGFGRFIGAIAEKIRNVVFAENQDVGRLNGGNYAISNASSYFRPGATWI